MKRRSKADQFSLYITIAQADKHHVNWLKRSEQIPHSQGTPSDMSSIAKGFGDLIGSILEIFKGLISTVVGFFQGMLNLVVGFIKNIFGAAEGLIGFILG